LKPTVSQKMTNMQCHERFSFEFVKPLTWFTHCHSLPTRITTSTSASQAAAAAAAVAAESSSISTHKKFARRRPLEDNAIARFGLHRLFDRNVLTIVRDYLGPRMYIMSVICHLSVSGID
jgi:hypothetical protein